MSRLGIHPKPAFRPPSFSLLLLLIQYGGFPPSYCVCARVGSTWNAGSSVSCETAGRPDCKRIMIRRGAKGNVPVGPCGRRRAVLIGCETTRWGGTNLQRCRTGRHRLRPNSTSGDARTESGRRVKFFCKSLRGEKRNISVLQLNKQRHGYTYLIACIIDRFRSRGVLCSIH